ncbi:SET and MYND domain-containing protein DDB_G0273589-like isoform X2 [Toxorhynchites rutilus septentrionalis]|uniref:SET and MYND domain-containing protein DDB_G0273589-like isoform X2 n=1 Tax=Toxorhynchites rutilus septentrionalis TaxID=329112 RepID=UPI00247A8874|nr:SET and MYND domain-containing protein DDB_G0273589-like isoform X2 [Toxorhynchites rutilus septentrionalis]
MEITESEGFFHQDYDKFRSNINDSEFLDFSRLRNDEQRVRFVNELRDRLGGLWKIERQVENSKCLSKTLELKELGNEAFMEEKWSDALGHYNKAFLYVPSGKSLDKAIVLANRSAVLFHLKKYDQAVLDMDLSIELNYPQDMMYKLMERKARCYLGNKDPLKALKYYRECFEALSSSKLKGENLLKWTKRIDKIICDLELHIATVKKYLEPVKSRTVRKFVPHFDKSLYFDCTEEEGRFARTSTDLKPNHILIKEQPHASVVTYDYSLFHCDHCCRRVEVLFCCFSCVDVVYCSEECRKLACTSYHQFECGFLSYLRNSGANVVCRLALRIVTQKSYDHFVSLQSSEDNLNQLSCEELNRLPAHDYRRVSHFVSHAERRNAEDSLKWTLMAVFLNAILLMSGFYNSTRLDGLIGTILLRNMGIVTYNSHEISELQRRRHQDPGKSVCIGAGLYPTLVLFNHSCDPDITRYFIGNEVYVRTVKNIAAGSSVSENYGQLFARSERKDRRKFLRTLYKFECNCRACVEDWPTVYEMVSSKVRFRCRGKIGCNNGLVYTEDCTSDALTCEKCGELTDINESFKLLKDTNMLNNYNEANRLHEMGECERALFKYAAIMNSLDQVLVQPYREYHLCQQGIRRCSLELGNMYVAQN